MILAAGISSRLYPLTLDKPKCLLKVGEKNIIERQIEAIRKIGITDILIVVGYLQDVISQKLGGELRYREYKDYAKTNNLHTLWSVRSDLNDDFICFFSDVLFDTELIAEAKVANDDFCMIIDTNRVLEGTMRVNIVNGELRGIGNQIHAAEASGNFIGIAKFSKEGSKKLFGQMEKMLTNHKNDYYTIAINELAKQGLQIGYIEAGDRMWVEIDTKEDYKEAKRLFGNK